MPSGTPPKRPLILITVYRRYFELSRAIDAVWAAFERGEFSEKPEVWLYWVQPEVGRLWYVTSLVRQGKVHRILSRRRLPDEAPSSPTSYPESVNIRRGLAALKEAYGGGSCYVVVQAADVLPKPGFFATVDQAFNEGGFRAALFHWENGANAPAWHTNFFAVTWDEFLWPPLFLPDQSETLEARWGSLLAKTNPPAVLRSHNSCSRYFTHDHISETVGGFPIIPQEVPGSLSLYVCSEDVREPRPASLLTRCIRSLKGANTSWPKLRSILTQRPRA